MKKALSILLTAVMLFSLAPLADFSGMSLTPKAKAETYQTGDHIEFGTYPQSLVTDDDLIIRLNVTDTEWISYEYYSGTGSNRNGGMVPSDYMKYRDVNIDGDWYRAVRFTKYRPTYTGETQTASNSNQDENGYFPDTIYWFKFEPILWRVLDAANGLVMSEIILDTQPYHNYTIEEYNYTIHEHSYYGNKNLSFFASNYSKSSIRSWMNNNFYNTAFSLSQKDIISLAHLENKTSFDSNYDAPDTDDNIFLLSYWDSLNPSYGFSSTEYDFGEDLAGGNEYARMTYGSDYAKSQGLRVTESNNVFDGKSSWWLRTPCYSWKAKMVDRMGYVSPVDGNVVYQCNGIRPAMCIDLGSIGEVNQDDEQPISLDYEKSYYVKNNQLYTAAGDPTDAVKVYLLVNRFIAGYLLSMPVSVQANVQSLFDDGTIQHYTFSESYTVDELLIAKKILIAEIPAGEIINNHLRGGAVKIGGDCSIYYDEDSLCFDFSTNEEDWIVVETNFDNAVLLSGYNFEKDSYSFENYSDPIDVNYYTDAYGKLKGLYLYNRVQSGHKEGKGDGHCYGMAATTGAFFQNNPSTSSFGETSLKNLNRESYSLDIEYFNMRTVDAFINFAHIYQYSSESSKKRKDNTDIQKVVSSVKKAIAVGKPVLLDILKNGKGHSILAVGYDRDNIIINDPNDPNYLHTLIVNGNTWSYSAHGDNYGSANQNTIDYNDDLTKITDSTKYITNYYVSWGKLITTSSAPVNYLSSDEMNEIRDTNGISDFQQEGNMYWVEPTNDLTAQNNNQTVTTVEVIGNEEGFEIDLNPNDIVRVSSTEEGNPEKMIISTTNNVSVQFTYIATNSDDDIKKIQVGGTANGNEITAESTENGLLVNGLNRIAVTYSENDENQSSTSAAVTDGRLVNITVDETNENVSADYVEDTPATQTDPETPTEEPTVPDTPTEPEKPATEPTGEKCKYCDTVHPNTFIGNLTKFFHSILYFFAHLFGKM